MIVEGCVLTNNLPSHTEMLVNSTIKGDSHLGKNLGNSLLLLNIRRQSSD